MFEDAIRRAVTPAEEREFQTKLRREQQIAEARNAPRQQMHAEALDQKQRLAQEAAQKKSADAAAAESRRQGEAAEKLAHQPVTHHTGGNRNQRKPLVVWHWRAVLPESLRGVIDSPPGFGPAFILTKPNEGERPDVVEARKSLAKRFPALRSDADASAWARSMKVLESDIRKRYPLLTRIRDEQWWTRVCESAKLTDPVMEERPWRGQFTSGTQKVTTIDSPTIVGVRVTREEGLTLRVQGRVGDSIERWNRALPVLRAAFQPYAEATNLRVTAPRSGGFVLRFDDTSVAFPKAVPLPDVPAVVSVVEAAKRYRETTWPIGVTAAGKSIMPNVKEVYNVLVSGGIGSGKSVFAATTITQFALSGWQIFLGDPKREFPTLEGSPGVVMRSTNAAEHAVLIAEVLARFLEREEAIEKEKASGNTDPAVKLPGLLMLLDEFATLRLDARATFGDIDELNVALETIIRRGRAARVHVVLCNQDIYADSIDMRWQNNFQQLVAFGEARGRTLKSEFVPPQLQDDAMRLAGRIDRKNQGRGVYVDRGGDRVMRVQSPYGYSPGTTDIEKAPELVRDSWIAQRGALNEMPRMYPRLGIEAAGPAWDRSGLAEVMKTATIPLENADGLIPEHAKYDPRSDEWIGKGAVRAGRRASASTFDEVTVKELAETEPEDTAEETPAPKKRAARNRARSEGTL
jgi:hypothetical protein